MSDNTSRDRSQTRGRIDLFNPQTLTPEEADLLRQLRFEAAWKRGYPLALIMGTGSAYLSRNFGRIGRIAFTITGAVTGNIIGKLSYISTMYQRILSDLPENSQLRQAADAFGKKDPSALYKQCNPENRNEDHGVQFDSKTYDNERELNIETEQGKQKPVTYDELRKKHRESQSAQPSTGDLGFLTTKPDMASNQTDDNPVPDITPFDAETEPKRVRYNKYGDAIVE